MGAIHRDQMHSYFTRMLEEKEISYNNPHKGLYLIDVYSGPLAVFLHDRTKYSHYKGERAELLADNMEVTDVLLKHPDHYHKFVSDKQKQLKSNSLKKYPRSNDGTKRPFLHGMISATHLERGLKQRMNSGPILYYQPDSERLSEKFRAYQLQSVSYDYSYMTQAEREFKRLPERAVSKDILFPQEVSISTHPLLERILETELVREYEEERAAEYREIMAEFD